MNPKPVKYFFMKWRMLMISTLMMSGVPSMCVEKREISVSLHDSTDDSVTIMIYRGEADPVMMNKDQTYMVKVKSAVHLNVFGKDRSQSVRHPINPSTTSVVLKPIQGDSGLRVEVEQNTFFSSLYSAIAKLFFANA
jgi:hypothetical protein